MLVLAGAGSGKTRVLVYRVAHLIQKGVPPEAILLLTFTNKAAREMLDRVARLVGDNEFRIWGGTFHHVGNFMLRRYSQYLGMPNNFAILDSEDSKFLLQECVVDLGIKTKATRFPKGDLLADILSYSLNTGKTLDEVVQLRYPHYVQLAKEFEAIFKRYETRKKSAFLVDFDDLLLLWYRLLTEFPEAREKMASQFTHILVDEYQDTNRLQAQIVKELALKHENVLVVGDDAQSIYSFRGAEFQNILDFPEDHAGTTIYRLETNYRSIPEILQLANAIIAKNERQFKKELRSVRPKGFLPAVIPLQHPDEQAAFVAQRILELRDEGFALSDMAILYRAHYQSAEIELELTRRNIPYELRSGLRFFEQAHIKDVLAFLRVVQNTKDELAWKRIFKVSGGIGGKTVLRIWEKLQQSTDPFLELKGKEIGNLVPRRGQERLLSLAELLLVTDKMKGNPSEAIRQLLEFYDDYLRSSFPNYRERKLDLEELSNFALRYQDVESFLSEIALQEGLSGEDILLPDEKEEGAVVLTTIHRAKGLEWRVVFVPWLLDGHFPLSYAYGKADAMEEERRLFYVAVTRAKDQIYMLYPALGYRQTVLSHPSPFLSELPVDLYEQWVVKHGVQELEPERETEQGGQP